MTEKRERQYVSKYCYVDITLIGDTANVYSFKVSENEAKALVETIKDRDLFYVDISYMNDLGIPCGELIRVDQIATVVQRREYTNRKTNNGQDA